MKHSREESEFIIAVVVIGRSLYLKVIEVFFVPAGSKSDTHGKTFSTCGIHVLAVPWAILCQVGSASLVVEIS